MLVQRALSGAAVCRRLAAALPSGTWAWIPAPRLLAATQGRSLLLFKTGPMTVPALGRWEGPEDLVPRRSSDHVGFTLFEG